MKFWPYVRLVFKSGFYSRVGYGGACTVYTMQFMSIINCKPCLSTSKISQRLSPPGTSTSSIDITQERFLSQSWKKQDVHSLISVMKNTKVKDGQLRQYIEKLLSMKREEIADLSVSTSVSSSGSFPSHTDSVGSGFVSSTPASILTSSRYVYGVKEYLKKSFQH